MGHANSSHGLWLARNNLHDSSGGLWRGCRLSFLLDLALHALLSADEESEFALSQGIEQCLDTANSQLIGQSVLIADDRGPAGMGEFLASRIVQSCSRWVLPRVAGEPLSIAVFAIPLLLECDTRPKFKSDASAQNFVNLLRAQGIFPEQATVSLNPYLYSFAELDEIGFVEVEEIGLGMLGTLNGLFPPLIDAPDMRITGEESMPITGRWRPYWLIGEVATPNDCFPLWLSTVSDSSSWMHEPDSTPRSDIFEDSLCKISAWKEVANQGSWFAPQTPAVFGLPVLAGAALPMVGASLGLLVLEQKLSRIALEPDSKVDIQFHLAPIEFDDESHLEILSNPMGITLKILNRQIVIAETYFVLSPFATEHWIRFHAEWVLSNYGLRARYEHAQWIGPLDDAPPTPGVAYN